MQRKKKILEKKKKEKARCSISGNYTSARTALQKKEKKLDRKNKCTEQSRYVNTTDRKRITRSIECKNWKNILENISANLEGFRFKFK